MGGGWALALLDFNVNESGSDLTWDHYKKNGYKFWFVHTLRKTLASRFFNLTVKVKKPAFYIEFLMVF